MDHRDDHELDLVLIDGAHSFPIPVIDWFYGAGRLRRGGVVVFDDIDLPAVRILLDSYLELDDRWVSIAGTSKWRAYRRVSEGALAEHESHQMFFSVPERRTLDKVIRRGKDLVPPGVRRMLRSRRATP